MFLFLFVCSVVPSGTESAECYVRFGDGIPQVLWSKIETSKTNRALTAQKGGFFFGAWCWIFQLKVSVFFRQKKKNIYIYIQSTFLTSIFEGQPLQTRPFPTKSIYFYLFILPLRITSKPLIPGFQSLVVQCTSLAVVAT